MEDKIPENIKPKEIEVLKLLVNGWYIPVDSWVVGNRRYFDLPYSPALTDEIKSMDGCKWHGTKVDNQWYNPYRSVPLNQRNRVTLSYLTGENNPFERYDKDLEHLEAKRELWPHQQLILDHMYTRKQCMVAAEQGTGKTLPMIELMEQSGLDGDEIYYVSTTAGLESLRLELQNWNSPVRPKMLTFEGLKKAVDEWTDADPPKMLIGDESSRLKGWDSQRSKAFKILAEAMREYYEECYIIELTGTPAPKNPLDWWMQTEIAFPGFLREGHPTRLEERLALSEWLESDAGQRYKKRLTWWDDERKCQKCGKVGQTCLLPTCEYQRSVNEVALLHERLKGLVLVVKKAEVLSHLPDKHYKIIKCEPTKEVKDLAKLVVDTSDNHMTSLTNLRTISDGFKYVDEIVGKKPCRICKGEGESEGIEDYEFEDFAEIPEFSGEVGMTTCWNCGGTGEVDKIKRTYIPIDCPKLDKMKDLLEQHEDDGRLVCFAAFTGSLDRIQELALKQRWTVFRVDGGGWRGFSPEGEVYKKEDLVRLFQGDELDRILWLAHPESSGTGLTLTASKSIVFYSRTFKGEDSAQAEDRCHRPGMDLNVGLTIYDLFQLPTDELVRNNIKEKNVLQNLTMGTVKTVLLEEIETYGKQSE